MKNGVIQKGRNDASDGYMVLRLDECVEWMGKQEFEKLLAQQQSEFEIEMLRK